MNGLFKRAELLGWLRRHLDACTLFLYLFLALLVTYPLVLHLSDVLPGRGGDDPYLAWNLWWVKWSLIDLQSNPLFSNYIFYPIGINLGSFTLTVLNGVVSIPLQLALGVVTANNLIVLATIVLAAMGTYLLVGDVLGRGTLGARTGAIVAGLIYGFGSYRFGYLNLGQFNFNSNEWLPYYVLFLRRLFRSPAPRSGLLAGLFFVFAGWSEATFAAFLSLLTAFFFVYRLLIDRARVFRRSTIFNFIALGSVSVIGLSPLFIAIGSDLQRYGDFLLSGSGGAELLSADLLSFFIPPQSSSLFGAWSKSLAFQSMNFAFVGYVTLALALLAIASRRRPAEFVFWGITAVLAAALMLGPSLHVANQTVSDSLPLPFRLLQSIPLVRANRLPIRYDHLLMLALAVLAGRGAAMVIENARHHAMIVLLLPTLVLVEQLTVPLSIAPLSIPKVYRTIGADPGDSSLLELPLGWRSSLLIQGRVDFRAQFYQSVHHKHLIGGNTSRYPPFKFQYFNEVPVINSLIRLEEGGTLDQATLEEDRKAGPEVARFFDLRYLVVSGEEQDARLLEYARQVFHLTPIAGDGAALAFRIETSIPPGPRIDSSQQLSQMYFDENWGLAQTGPDGEAFRWATGTSAILYAPLSRVDYQVCGMYAGAREGQRVRLSIGDKPFADLTLQRSWAQHCVSLPAQALRTGMNYVTFDSQLVPLRDTGNPEDLNIGQTGVTSPADIAVTSAGFFAGKFASITNAGHELYEAKRGFHIMAIDSKRLIPDSSQVFDTFRDEAESARMVEFIRGLPSGTIVAGAVSDEATRNLTLDAVNALRTLGLSTDLRSRFRASYAFIGVKGSPSGSAIEDLNSSFPANVYVGKDVTTPSVSFALGTLEFSPINN